MCENDLAHSTSPCPLPEPLATSQLLEMGKDLVSEDYKMAIHNSLKIMDGKFGGGFFVRFLLDVGRMYGWLNLIIVYPSGLYKSLILYKNSLKETDTENNGVCQIEKSRNRLVRNFDEPELDNYVCFPQYETPDMVIPAEALWKKIYENYRRIPIVRINNTLTIMEIYEEIKKVAAENAKEYGSSFMDSDDCFYIRRDEFRLIVEESGRTESEIKTAFDTMGLFVKDKGTAGYQYSRRINGQRERFYVLKKSFPQVENEPVSLQDTSYAAKYENKQEKAMSELKSDNSRLFKKYNELAVRYNDLVAETGREAVDIEL